MTASRCETTDANRHPMRGRIVVQLALALLSGLGASQVAPPRASTAPRTTESAPPATRLAREDCVPLREARGGDPAGARLRGWRVPHRPEQLRTAWLHGPMPTAELPDRGPAELRREAAQPWYVDTAGVAAALANARRASAPDDRASSLRAAFAAVVARRGPPVPARSRTL